MAGKPKPEQTQPTNDSQDDVWASPQSSPPSPSKSIVPDTTDQPSTVWQTSVSAAAATVVRWIETLRPWINQLQMGWRKLLNAIRQQLPNQWQGSISDRLLGSGIAALSIGLVWLLAGLSPGAAPAITPPVTLPSPVATSTSSSPLQLTPPLITSIQAQLSEVIDRYTDGQIQSTQADFRSRRLTITIAGWEELSPARQAQLAADLLARSHTLHFDRLELINAEGIQLARSPVVGTTMVMK